MRRDPWRQITTYALCTAWLLLTGCGTTQPAARGARAGHAQDDSAPWRHKALSASGIVLASGGTRDCDAEQIACFDDCWNSPPPYEHIERGRAGHYKYCTTMCLKKYMECCKQQELRPRAFPDMKAALDWLKERKTEVLVGSVVVVAGAAFIVSAGAAGALVLLPLAAI